MGKDMGCRVGEGGHSQREGPGAARRTGRRSPWRGTEVVVLGGPELSDFFRPEEAPKGSGQAWSGDQRPPAGSSWPRYRRLSLSSLPWPSAPAPQSPRLCT